ncbi:TetR/AcrR family transcriptional regulator [Echinicola jeungdonensis]|uniref:TetR/AcrR family transcriptional regulator n=1 Tax=Echinicola jeungdonensis TaxID=709343 RepID=A0ABV5J2X4_9BACT
MKFTILNRSIELIKKYGHRSVSMDEVALKLGISKKTLYQHFPS